jgi:putative oxidoreductase
MFGHGAQKLFGWFGGQGLKGAQGLAGAIGMRPQQMWGTLNALGEFGGGVLTILGFLNPLGPLNIAASMYVAVRRVHWKLPIWVSEGGAEFAALNFAAAITLALSGPGRYSLDRMFGIRLPRVMSLLAWITTLGATGIAVRRPELVEIILERFTGGETPPDVSAGTPETGTASPETEQGL